MDMSSGQFGQEMPRSARSLVHFELITVSYWTFILVFSNQVCAPPEVVVWSSLLLDLLQARLGNFVFVSGT